MEPSYSLPVLRQLVSTENYRITVSALESAALMELDDADIVECILDHLNESHFYKTMPSTSVRGLMQDVYKIAFQGRRIYLKLQINASQTAVVISFKEDESFI